MARVLVTGASGFLGWNIATRLARDGHAVTGTFRQHGERVPGPATAVPLDLRDDAGVDAALAAGPFDAVVHAAALAGLGACEADADLAERVNVRATARIAAGCASSGTRLIFLSTDSVFDGRRGGYREADPPNPLQVYGRTKLHAEQAISEANAPATVLRLGLVYGRSPQGGRSCSEQVRRALADGEAPRLFVDEIRTPVSAADVAEAVAELLLRDDVPLLHLGGPDRVSRYELGVAVAEAAGLDPKPIVAARQAEAGSTPARPRDVSLDTRLARATLRHPPRPLRDALRDEDDAPATSPR